MIGKMQNENNINNIIYGTAKLGDLNYGFSSDNNINSESREQLVREIIDKGIKRFDTSPRYGDAEIILGKVIKESSKKIKVDSKIIDLKSNDSNSNKSIFTQVENSLKKLNISSLNVLYLHQNELEILKDKNIQNSLKTILKKGLAKKIGSSVYSHAELEYSLQNDLFTTIQAPINILNKSFYNKFSLSKTNNEKELIARSIFLQGTLLNVDDSLLKKVNIKLFNSIQELKKICDRYNTTILNEAKRTVYDLKNISVIQSSLSIKNIDSNLHFYSNPNENSFEKEIQYLRDSNYTFTNPRNWNF